MPSKKPSPLVMDASAIREALAQHGFSQEGLAVSLGYSGRAGQRWATGEAKVPGAVAVILRLLEERPELVTVLNQITGLGSAGKKSKAGRPAAKHTKKMGRVG